jgi:transcriptional regulator with XRE-family HTH domain
MKLKVKELRTTKGWTQEHLAEIAGTTKSHISEIENGRKNPSNPMLDKLARAFQISVIDLIDQEKSSDLHTLMREIESLSPANQTALRQIVQTLLAGENS